MSAAAPLPSGTLVAREVADFAPWLRDCASTGIDVACGGVLVGWGTLDERIRKREQRLRIVPRDGFDPPVRWRVVLIERGVPRVLEVEEARIWPFTVQPWGGGVVLVDWSPADGESDTGESAAAFDAEGRLVARFAAGDLPGVARSTPDGTLWTGSIDESGGLLEYGLVARDAKGGARYRDWTQTPAGGFMSCEAINVIGDDDLWALSEGSTTLSPLVHVTRDGFDFWPLGDVAGTDRIGSALALAVRPGRVLALVTDDDRGEVHDRWPARAREFALGPPGEIREVARHGIVDAAGRSLVDDWLLCGCLGGVGGTLYFQDRLVVRAVDAW